MHSVIVFDWATSCHSYSHIYKGIALPLVDDFNTSKTKIPANVCTKGIVVSFVVICHQMYAAAKTNHCLLFVLALLQLGRDEFVHYINDIRKSTMLSGHITIFQQLYEDAWWKYTVNRKALYNRLGQKKLATISTPKVMGTALWTSLPSQANTQIDHLLSWI